MQVLLVYAHPEPKSFNGSMRDLAVETLSAGVTLRAAPEKHDARRNAILRATCDTDALFVIVASLDRYPRS